MSNRVGSIVILKLLSGQEVIGKIATVDDVTGDLAVSTPLTLQAMPQELPPGPDGSPRQTIKVGFLPFSWGAKTAQVMFRADHITAVMEPEDEMRNQYATITGDIVIASPRVQLVG